MITAARTLGPAFFALRVSAVFCGAAGGGGGGVAGVVDGARAPAVIGAGAGAGADGAISAGGAGEGIAIGSGERGGGEAFAPHPVARIASAPRRGRQLTKR